MCGYMGSWMCFCRQDDLLRTMAPIFLVLLGIPNYEVQPEQYKPEILSSSKSGVVFSSAPNTHCIPECCVYHTLKDTASLMPCSIVPM